MAMQEQLLKPETKVWTPKMYLEPPRNSKNKVVLPNELYVKINHVIDEKAVYLSDRITVLDRIDVLTEEKEEIFNHRSEVDGTSIRKILKQPFIRNYRIDGIENFYKTLASDCSIENIGTACRENGVYIDQEKFSEILIKRPLKKYEPIKSYVVVPTERNDGNFKGLDLVGFYHDLGDYLNLTKHKIKKIEANITQPKTVNGPRINTLKI